jgi:hypothetical protein
VLHHLKVTSFSRPPALLLLSIFADTIFQLCQCELPSLPNRPAYCCQRLIPFTLPRPCSSLSLALVALAILLSLRFGSPLPLVQENPTLLMLSLFVCMRKAQEKGKEGARGSAWELLEREVPVVDCRRGISGRERERMRNNSTTRAISAFDGERREPHYWLVTWLSAV